MILQTQFLFNGIISYFAEQFKSFLQSPLPITPKACISSCSAGTVYHQCEALYIIKAQARCTLARDEIQGRLAALDDMHHASRGDDMPSLREPPKLGKLASGNPYCGLDKKALQKSTLFCSVLLVEARALTPNTAIVV